MIGPPPRPPRTHPLFPYTTLFRSEEMGFGFMALAKPGFRVRAGSVAVTQADRLQPISDVIVPEHLLEHPLAAAVRVDRRPGVGFVARGVLGVADHRGGRREDELVHTVPPHATHQHLSPAHVV